MICLCREKAIYQTSCLTPTLYRKDVECPCVIKRDDLEIAKGSDPEDLLWSEAIG